MSRIIHLNPNPEQPPQVKAPWGRKQELGAEAIEYAYANCRRGDMGRCIHSNLCRAFAELQGRTIRAPQTNKGTFRWSELIDGRWCRYRAPLLLKYAERVDYFDRNGGHFRALVRTMGPAEFVGYCVERRDTRDQREERRSRVNARVESGQLVPGARFRELQVPYVLRAAE